MTSGTLPRPNLLAGLAENVNAAVRKQASRVVESSLLEAVARLAAPATFALVGWLCVQIFEQGKINGSQSAVLSAQSASILSLEAARFTAATDIATIKAQLEDMKATLKRIENITDNTYKKSQSTGSFSSATGG